MSAVRLRVLFAFLALLSFGAQVLPGQVSLAVSPAEITFRMVAGGPVAPQQTLSVTVQGGGSGDWRLTVGDNFKNGLQVAPSSGSGSATVSVSLVSWWAAGRQPGEYTGTITLSPEGSTVAAATVTVRLNVLAKAPAPQFTYLSGPNNCSQPDGYPDQAVCTVPDERPPGGFSPPPVGKTYVDPNFGATVKVLADPVSRHQYSTPSPISAHNKYVLVFDAGMRFTIVSAATGRVLYYDVTADVGRGTFWDAYDDEVYYFLSGSSVRKHDLRTRRTTTLIDYATSGHGFSSIQSGGTGDGSKDNWISFWAPEQRQLCALDLNMVKTYCANYATLGAVPVSFVDFTLISRGVDSQSGKRYVLLMSNPAMAVFSVNLSAGRLDPEFRGPEDPEGNGNHNGACDPGENCFGAPHADIFEDSNGIQYLVATTDTRTPCERALATYQLNKGNAMRLPVELGGGKRTVMTVFKCGTTWGGDHIGCAKSAPYCAISTNFAGLRDPKDQSPIQHTPHIAEIFIMRENGEEIRRLVKHRSVLFQSEEASGYWSRPRASISNDGGFVVAESNFGFPNQQRVVLITTGYGKPRISPSGIVNSASFAPEIAPGGFVTVFGSSLTLDDCQASAEHFPLPQSLCGTAVTFNEQPAHLSYADPWQLNAVLPAAIVPGQNVRVEVARPADRSPPFDVPGSSVLSSAPAVFFYSLEDQVPRAIAQNSDGSLNGPLRSDLNSRPLRPGEWGVLYANTLGPTDPAIPEGQATPESPLTPALYDIEVFINDVRQTTIFAGLTPTVCALYQVNFLFDSSTPIRGGNQDSVRLTVNGVSSRPLTISLSPAG